MPALTLNQPLSEQPGQEYSEDNSTWYRDATYTTSGGTLTYAAATRKLTASGNYRFPIEILDRFVRVSVKGTGTVTSSLMEIKANKGNVNTY